GRTNSYGKYHAFSCSDRAWLPTPSSSNRSRYSRNAEMTLTFFAASRYVIVMVLCVTAYAIGRASLQRLLFITGAEKITLCTAFGLGVLSQVILIVGLFGWLAVGGIITVIVLSLLFALGCGLSRTEPLPVWRHPSLQTLGAIIYAGGQTRTGVWMDTFSFKNAATNTSTASSEAPAAK